MESKKISDKDAAELKSLDREYNGVWEIHKAVMAKPLAALTEGDLESMRFYSNRLKALSTRRIELLKRRK